MPMAMPGKGSITMGSQTVAKQPGQPMSVSSTPPGLIPAQQGQRLHSQAELQEGIRKHRISEREARSMYRQESPGLASNLDFASEKDAESAMLPAGTLVTIARRARIK
jgi:hypothetical protein